MESYISKSFTAVASAIFSATLTYIISLYSNYKKSIDEQITVLSAILNELVSLYLLITAREQDYESNYKDCYPDNLREYYFLYFPITYNYFNIYESLTYKFGSINNRLLVNDIICTYIDLKGFFENLKDLEYYAKEGDKIAFYHPNSEQHIKIVKSHHTYATYLKNKQLPIIKEILTQTIQKLKDEITVIESKRTKKEFLKSLL